MKIYSYRGRKNVSGEKIHEFRTKRRLSQSELAARIQLKGVMLERDSISRIESGARFVADYELHAFAEVLGVEVTELFDIESGEYLLLFTPFSVTRSAMNRNYAT